MIATDTKGNIIVFSKNENKLLYKYNFYKKSYKKINKKLNFILDKNIVYVTDNMVLFMLMNIKKIK